MCGFVSKTGLGEVRHRITEAKHALAELRGLYHSMS
jgi:hypothetical protein